MNIASSAELNRGVSNLYSQLRENMQKNDGAIEGGFEKSFTSADGLVTISLSVEGVGAYEGAKAGDVALHVKAITRSGSGRESVTSESNALSDVITSADDVIANEAFIKQNLGPTETIDARDIRPSPQAPETLEQKASGILLNAPDTAKSKQEATNRLIDTLTTFLQSLKGDKSESLKSLIDDPLSSKDAAEEVQQIAKSLTIRIDVKA